MFRLTDFEGEEQEGVVFNKSDCKEHKLEKTKGDGSNITFYVFPALTSLYVLWLQYYEQLVRPVENIIAKTTFLCMLTSLSLGNVTKHLLLAQKKNIYLFL